MIADNRFWHFSRDDRDFEASMISYSFNPPRKSFQENVVKRGLVAFKQAYQSFQ